jgi:phosphate transport system protein
MMSSLTDRILQTAFEALLNRDSERCDHVVAEDEEIDVLEKQLDQDGVSLLLRFHPVASDMREVLSAMKISTELERIADQAVTITQSQTPEQRTSSAGNCLARAGLSVGGGDFSR